MTQQTRLNSDFSFFNFSFFHYDQHLKFNVDCANRCTGQLCKIFGFREIFTTSYKLINKMIRSCVNNLLIFFYVETPSRVISQEFWKFSEQLFYRVPLGDCIFHFSVRIQYLETISSVQKYLKLPEVESIQCLDSKPVI